MIMKPGSFTFENGTGAKGTLQIPGKPDPEIEKLRTLVPSAPKVTYLTVHVDNRQGTEAVNMYGVSLLPPPAGEELEYKGAGEYISSITPSGDVPADMYQFIHAGTKHNARADPKSVRKFIIVGPAVPAEITVYPTDVRCC